LDSATLKKNALSLWYRFDELTDPCLDSHAEKRLKVAAHHFQVKVLTQFQNAFGTFVNRVVLCLYGEVLAQVLGH
jgi:hypothetical protein